MVQKKETRGRKALPPEQKKPPQKSVKINPVILPFVQALKGHLKKGLVSAETITVLFNTLDGGNVAHNQTMDALTEKVRALEKANFILGLQRDSKQLETGQSEAQQRINLDLVYQRDQEHLKAVKLAGEVRSLESSLRSARTAFNQLKHYEHDCQALTASRTRCSRPARVKAHWHGVEINVCLQHAKKIVPK